MNWLVGQFGIDRLRLAQVVLPTPKFFPDSYTANADGARLLLNRVCQYMGVDPATIDLQLFEDRNPVYEGEMRLGTAGLYEAVPGRYRIWIEVGNLHDPLALVATIAHELAHVHLLGHGRISADVEDHEPLTDLLTVFLGMGVITANAVIRESHTHAGAFSVGKMGRRGYLSMLMYGYALALFARARGEEHATWVNELRPDVRSSFKKACQFLAVDGNATSGSVSSTSRSRELSQEVEYPNAVEGKEGVRLSAEELLKRHAAGERDFRHSDLWEINLYGVDLRGADLSGADLRGADLADAVLTGADLHDCDLQGAVLRQAILRGSNLNGSDLGGADLSGADLSGADIRGADFAGGCLHQAILNSTLRDRSTDLTSADLSQVVCDAKLSDEELRGPPLPSDRIIAGYFGVGRWITRMFMVALAAGAGATLCGLVGGFCGEVLGFRGLYDPLAVAGAVLFAIIAIWKLAEPWRREKGKSSRGSGKS